MHSLFYKALILYNKREMHCKSSSDTANKHVAPENISIGIYYLQIQLDSPTAKACDIFFTLLQFFYLYFCPQCCGFVYSFHDIFSFRQLNSPTAKTCDIFFTLLQFFYLYFCPQCCGFVYSFHDIFSFRQLNSPTAKTCNIFLTLF
mgnify:CR=1 FL=1